MKISFFKFLLLLVGVLLIVSPIIYASTEYADEDSLEETGEAEEEDPYEDVDIDEEEEEEETDDIDEKDVVVLTSKNFESIVSKSKFALVEFYAPWCGHCKSLKPEYAAAATEIKAINADVILAKVDATVESELAEQFSIQGFPTLQWFVDGDIKAPKEFSGGRTKSDIVSWVKRKTGPPATDANSADDIKNAEKNSEVVLVGYFNELKGAEHEAFIKAARSVDDIEVLQTTDAGAAKAADLSSAPSVAIIRNFEDSEPRAVSTITKDITEKSIAALVSKYKLPLICPFSEKYQQKLFESDFEKHVFVGGDAASLKNAELLKPIKEVAESLRGKVAFISLDVASEDGQRVAEFLSIDEHKEGIKLVGFDMESSKKFMYDGAQKVDDIKKWVQLIRDGKAEPYFKSADIPKDGEDYDGGVKVVVGKTVESVAMDPKKDVILEVYAPWCGHCKSLAPIWKKLAKRFESVDSVVVAKMDGTQNEHPSIESEGFPMILFYPAEKGAAAVSYEGDRSLKDLTKFVKDNAKIPYELAKKKTDDKKEDEETDQKTEL